MVQFFFVRFKFCYRIIYYLHGRSRQFRGPTLNIKSRPLNKKTKNFKKNNTLLNYYNINNLKNSHIVVSTNKNILYYLKKSSILAVRRRRRRYTRFCLYLRQEKLYFNSFYLSKKWRPGAVGHLAHPQSP
jgi:hypothetical protein